GVWADHLADAGPGAGGSPHGARGNEQPANPAHSSQTLASALIDRADAAFVLGADVGPAQEPGRLLLRRSSLCRYRAVDRSASLTVAVHHLSRAVSVERFARRGTPIPDLGDSAGTLP